MNATARAAGLLRGRRRVLDSTPLLDAVATQDTVTQLRAAIRKLLTVADGEDAELAAAVRAVLMRDDNYATVGKPPCEWDDKAARGALVDALVRDANVALLVLHGRELAGALGEAAELLALVAGQDVEQGEDGVFRIAKRVARDRVISTVDTEARHGYKSRARTFDGYKAHLAVDPDEELITTITLTPANAADRDVIDDLLDESDSAGTEDRGGDDADVPEPVAVFGDSAYGDGSTLDRLAEAGHEVFAKVPPVRNAKGYSNDEFSIDPDAGTVDCPAGHTAPIRTRRGGGGLAAFRPGAPAAHCARPAPPHGPGG